MKTKARKVLDLLNSAPAMTNRQIAAKVGCHKNYVHALRRKMVHVEACPEDTLELTGEMVVHEEAEIGRAHV